MDLLKYASKQPVLIQEDFNLERCSRETKDDIETLQNRIKKSREEMSTLQEWLKPEARINNGLQREVDNLDNKIEACLNKQLQAGKSLSSGQLNGIDEKGARGKLKNHQVYEEMFYILWRNPRYLAIITPHVETVDRSEFAHAINYDLWSDDFDSTEEQVLLTLFQHVIEADFKQASSDEDIGSVFRGNTVVTKILSLYCMRTKGMQALKTVLHGPLKGILENTSLNLEIDAVKVYREVVKESGDEKSQENISPEKALANSYVKALRSSRLRELKIITQNIFDQITEAVDEIPFGIRYICKLVAESGQKYFPKCDKNDIGRLIGGYIFLRFFNPVIVQPARANMFRETKLTKWQKRNLILVTRILQSQSNGSIFRDQMMLELNDFLEENRDRTLQYFQRLIQIDTLERNTEIDAMLESTKRRQPSITLKCNQIYLFHRLLWEHYDRWDLRDDPILKYIKQLGKAPKAVSRNNDFEVLLKLQPPQTETLSEDEKSDISIRRRRSTLGNAAEAVSDKIPIWNNLHYIFHYGEYPMMLMRANNQSLLRFLETLLQWARNDENSERRSMKARLCDWSNRINFGCSSSADVERAPIRKVSRRVIFGSFPGALEMSSMKRKDSYLSLVSHIEKCMDSMDELLFDDSKEVEYKHSSPTPEKPNNDSYDLANKKARERKYNEFLLEYVRYIQLLTFCVRRSTKKLDKMKDAKGAIMEHHEWLKQQKKQYVEYLYAIQSKQGMMNYTTEKRTSIVSSIKRSVSVFGSKMTSGRKQSG